MNGSARGSGVSSITLAAIFTAALAGLAGVVLGAYAAHWAPAELRDGLSVASNYALVHALALIAAGLVHDRASGTCASIWLLRISMLAFASGIALFSGGLYLRIGTAPTGGILLMAGWLLLAFGAGTLLFKTGRRNGRTASSVPGSGGLDRKP